MTEQRITWTQNTGIGRSGWTGSVGKRCLFTIEYSISRRSQWVLTTRLPVVFAKNRNLSGNPNELKNLAERVLDTFVRSLGAVFFTPSDDLKASYRMAADAHAALYEGVDAPYDPEAPEDNGWRRGPHPIRLADFFSDLSATGILDPLKD